MLCRRFLPPAYVVRREGTVFTGVCLLTFVGGGGTPARSGWWGRVPWSGLDGGGGGGLPWTGLDGGRGVPHSWGWGYPSQVWMVGGTLFLGWGYPPPTH